MNQALWQIDSTKIQSRRDLVHEILTARGIKDPDDFLKITKKKLHNPYKLRNMKKAVTKIIDAVQSKKKIGIFGDYDCDGVSSTSIWLLVLRELGADVVYFIPDRFKDGYGVGKRGIEFMKNNGVDLVITCDTGITAIEQVHTMKKLGMDVIVTDHHEPQEVEAYGEEIQKKGRIVNDFLIPKTVVVNPKRPDCTYPFEGLAGVGVSFKVLCAVCDKIHPAGRAGAYQFMDIVALGTFADMMEIMDENRVICSLGLEMMNHTSNRGLYQLLRANEITNVTSQDIGWSIAPCINAAGRIVSAEDAVEMLISTNKLDAYRCAKKLVEINKERKDVTKTHVSAIIEAIEIEQSQNPTAFIMHYHPGIPEGIVGLIASRVMNHFYKPTIIMTDAEEENLYKGSGRSIESMNLFKALMKQTDLMAGFGGHAAACGVSVTSENFPILKARMEMYADAILSEADLQPKIFIDAVVKPDIIDIPFAEEVLKLEPFGNGNKKPIFMIEDLFVLKAKPVGDEKNHFWALLKDNKTNKTFASIGFFLWEKYAQIGEPRRIDVAFYPDINEYPQGKFNVQLKLEDLRKSKRKK